MKVIKDNIYVIGLLLLFLGMMLALILGGE
jgi:hypothetical protein